MTTFKRSSLSVLALAMGAALCASRDARAALAAVAVPVYGSVNDIAENAVVLTGDATVRSTRNPGSVTVSIHLNNVTGRSVMSGVALQATGDQTVTLPLAAIATGTANIQMPVTLFPAGSDATDPTAFAATATVAAKINPSTGAATGGLGQFQIVLTPAP